MKKTKVQKAKKSQKKSQVKAKAPKKARGIENLSDAKPYYFGKITIQSLAAVGVHAVIGKRAE